jgi:hypothetical protein
VLYDVASYFKGLQQRLLASPCGSSCYYVAVVVFFCFIIVIISLSIYPRTILVFFAQFSLSPNDNSLRRQRIIIWARRTEPPMKCEQNIFFSLVRRQAYKRFRLRTLNSSCQACSSDAKQMPWYGAFTGAFRLSQGSSSEK